MRKLLYLLAFGFASAFSLQGSAATLAIGAEPYLPPTDRLGSPSDPTAAATRAAADKAAADNAAVARAAAAKAAADNAAAGKAAADKAVADNAAAGRAATAEPTSTVGNKPTSRIATESRPRVRSARRLEDRGLF